MALAVLVNIAFYVCVYISFVCRYVALPSECYYNTVLLCDYFYRFIAYSSLCVYIRSSGIILISLATFMPNFVSVAASVAEIAHGEKSHTQSFNHPAYLMPREPKLALRKTNFYEIDL